MTTITNNKQGYYLDEGTFQNELKAICSSYWKNQHSLGHWYLEFEICLGFVIWDLGFQ